MDEQRGRPVIRCAGSHGTLPFVISKAKVFHRVCFLNVACFRGSIARVGWRFSCSGFGIGFAQRIVIMRAGEGKGVISAPVLTSVTTA